MVATLGAVRIVRAGDDVVARMADQTAGGGTHSLRAINPQGWDRNCGACALALEATLGGAPASALDSGVLLTSDLAELAGKQAADWGVVRYSPDSIRNELEVAGRGRVASSTAVAGPRSNPCSGISSM